MLIGNLDLGSPRNGVIVSALKYFRNEPRLWQKWEVKREADKLFATPTSAHEQYYINMGRDGCPACNERNNYPDAPRGPHGSLSFDFVSGDMECALCGWSNRSNN